MRAARLFSTCTKYLSEHHNNLSTFLKHAEDVSLSTKSTVYIGTHYEYTVQEALKRLGFSLSRTGGALDQGIDLRGSWTPPSIDYPLEVFIQCKALARKTGPNIVRELEGAFASFPAVRDDNGFEQYPSTMGILVTSSEATKAVRDTLGRSRFAMGFAKVTRQGIVEQLLWNRAASDGGLAGIGVTVQYMSPTKNQLVAIGTQEQIALTWKGELWSCPSEEGK